MTIDLGGNVRIDLFSPTVDENRWHPQFRSLLRSPLHQYARAMINALYSRMGRKDKNFIEDFQTAGFHSRLFEIACYAYLENAGFKFDHRYNRPDFVVSRGDIRLALEATSANSPTGRETDISITKMENLSEDEIVRKVTQEFPKRIVSILTRKLKREYHTLPQCVDRPLVLLVAPLFEPGAPFYTDDAVVPCLYEFGRDALPQNAPSPFFQMAGAENISAVLYINGYSVSRFLRASTPMGPGAELSGYCWGMHCLSTHSGQITYAEYKYELGVDSPAEPWSQGVTMYLNPNARMPVSTDLLPCSSAFSLHSDRLQREIFGFHPVTRVMHLWPTSATQSEL